MIVEIALAIVGILVVAFGVVYATGLVYHARVQEPLEAVCRAQGHQRWPAGAGNVCPSCQRVRPAHDPLCTRCGTDEGMDCRRCGRVAFGG